MFDIFSLKLSACAIFYAFSNYANYSLKHSLTGSKSEVWKEKEKVFEPAFYELPSSSYFEINSGTVSEARW